MQVVRAHAVFFACRYKVLPRDCGRGGSEGEQVGGVQDPHTNKTCRTDKGAIKLRPHDVRFRAKSLVGPCCVEQPGIPVTCTTLFTVRPQRPRLLQRGQDLHCRDVVADGATGAWEVLLASQALTVLKALTAFAVSAVLTVEAGAAHRSETPDTGPAKEARDPRQEVARGRWRYPSPSLSHVRTTPPEIKGGG